MLADAETRSVGVGGPVGGVELSRTVELDDGPGQTGIVTLFALSVTASVSPIARPFNTTLVFKVTAA